MKKISGLCLALLAGAACVPPQGVKEADLAAFDAAVASVGCQLETERQYLAVELQTGMPRETVMEVAQYRVGRKEAVGLESGGVRLVTGSCVPPAAPVAAG